MTAIRMAIIYGPGVLAVLIGPLIGYRRWKPSNIGVIGLLVIAIVFALYLCFCVFCQGRLDCPYWLIVYSPHEPNHQGASSLK